MKCDHIKLSAEVPLKLFFSADKLDVLDQDLGLEAARRRRIIILCGACAVHGRIGCMCCHFSSVRVRAARPSPADFRAFRSADFEAGTILLIITI